MEEIMEVDVPEFQWNEYNKHYRNTSVETLDRINVNEADNLKKQFISIGFFLRLTKESGAYKELGYGKIEDYAYDRMGYSESRTRRLMQINAMASKDGCSPVLDEQYKAFKSSQLQEMLSMLEDQRQLVTPDMTVRQIKDMKKALAPIEIAGYQCTKVDEWTTDGDTYILGSCIDDNNFFYASVNSKEEFEFDHKPTREEVEGCYIDLLAMQDIDRHEAEVMGFGMGDQEKELETESKELEELHKPTEEELIIEFYKHLYTSEKYFIRERKAAAITSLFKNEYGGTYDTVCSPNISWNCYPDKVCFFVHGIGQVLQITWGKFTTKLLRILDDQPELEKELEIPGQMSIADFSEAMPDADGESQECYSGEDEEAEICATSHKTETVPVRYGVEHFALNDGNPYGWTWSEVVKAYLLDEGGYKSPQGAAEITVFGVKYDVYKETGFSQRVTFWKGDQKVFIVDNARLQAEYEFYTKKCCSISNNTEIVPDQVIDSECIELPEEPKAAAVWPELLSDMPVFSLMAVKDYLDDQERELREYLEVDQSGETGLPKHIMLQKRMEVAGARLLMQLVEGMEAEDEQSITNTV